MPGPSAAGHVRSIEASSDLIGNLIRDVQARIIELKHLPNRMPPGSLGRRIN
jgi:hypothetical protein